MRAFPTLEHFTYRSCRCNALNITLPYNQGKIQGNYLRNGNTDLLPSTYNHYGAEISVLNFTL